jgi:hypothetical protein
LGQNSNRQTSRPIQIRTLPRTGEQKVTRQSSVPPSKPHEPIFKRRKHFSTGAVILIAGIASAFVFMWEPPQTKKKPITVNSAEDNSPEAKVNRYLKEINEKYEMAKKNSDFENKSSSQPLSPDARIIPEPDRNLGVAMDQENSAEKVYNDLYHKEPNTGPMLPADRIAFRLAERKWMSEVERQERKQYVQNFISQAAEAGYAIDLDENLIVTKVKKITDKPKEPLDKVLENIARKGY